MDASRAFLAAEERVFADYQLAATQRFVQLRDPPLRTRVLEAGEGPPLFFVHGGGGFASQWASLMAGLPGRRSIAVDRPGCGLTQGFDYRGVDLRTHSVAFLGSLLDALGLERVPIVANSMGAMWSIFFALQQPERVSMLALLGCPALFPGTGAPLWLRVLSSGPLRRTLMKPRTPPPDRMRSGLSRMLGQQAATLMTAAEIESMQLAQRIPGASDSFGSLLGQVLTLWGPRPGAGITRDELGSLSVPTLLVWSREDPFGDIAAARQGTELLPRGQLEVVDGGHQPWSAQPQRCAQLVSAFVAAVSE